MVILFAKIVSKDMYTDERRGRDLEFLQHITTCWTLALDFLEDLKNFPSTKIEDVGQLTTTSNEDREIKLVTTNTLKQDCNKAFSKIMTKMKSKPREKYDGKENQDVLL